MTWLVFYDYQWSADLNVLKKLKIIYIYASKILEICNIFSLEMIKKYANILFFGKNMFLFKNYLNVLQKVCFNCFLYFLFWNRNHKKNTLFKTENNIPYDILFKLYYYFHKIANTATQYCNQNKIYKSTL